MQYRKRPIVIEAIKLIGAHKAGVVNGVQTYGAEWATADEPRSELPQWLVNAICAVNQFDMACIIKTDGALSDDIVPEGAIVLVGNGVLVGTSEGMLLASPGDFIIRGIQGELYPCKPDIFASTYTKLAHENDFDQIGAEQRTAAWYAVCEALNKVAPGWLSGEGDGSYCAVKAIERLTSAKAGDGMGRHRGVQAFLAERIRQVRVEGWTIDGDNDHHNAELARAAACYAMPAHLRDSDGLGVPTAWPWQEKWWKPARHGTLIDRKREIEKAGGLLAAEWERLDRIQGLTVVTPVANTFESEYGVMAPVAEELRDNRQFLADGHSTTDDAVDAASFGLNANIGRTATEAYWLGRGISIRPADLGYLAEDGMKALEAVMAKHKRQERAVDALQSLGGDLHKLAATLEGISRDLSRST